MAGYSKREAPEKPDSMSNAYKATGLRVLAAPDGSVIIADAGWKTGTKMSFHINRNMLDRASESEREASLIFRQLALFLKKHHDIKSQ